MYKLHGVSIINVYNGSQYQLLCAVYPDYEWLPWKFEFPPVGYFSSIENQKKFVEWAGKELGIKDSNDWYKVKPEVIMVIVKN